MISASPFIAVVFLVARVRGERRFAGRGARSLRRQTSLTGAAWSLRGIGLGSDMGLMAIRLGSPATSQPWMRRYARGRVPPESWDGPVLRSADRAIAWVWATAFAVICTAGAWMMNDRGLALFGGGTLIALALAEAVKFTSWYPRHRRAALARADRAA